MPLSHINSSPTTPAAHGVRVIPTGCSRGPETSKRHSRFSRINFGNSRNLFVSFAQFVTAVSRDRDSSVIRPIVAAGGVA